MRIINRLSFVFLFSSITFNSWCQVKDRFAEIGNKAAATRLNLLVTPKPLVLKYRSLSLANSTANAFVPMNKLDTKEELAL
ncbi:MAG TPA: hypothetical protein VEY06_02955, partial [Flavisolibacter sp.]|nr:hypothetical protein [Flavisolibacter sp.]